MLLFTCFISYGQVNTAFNGSVNIFGGSGSQPNYNVIGFFNDALGYYSSDSVSVGDIIYLSAGTTCARLRVDTINSSAGGILDLDVTDIDNAFPSSPSGIGAIMNPSTNYELPVYTANISETLRACIQTHFALIVDDIQGGGSGNELSKSVTQSSHGFSQFEAVYQGADGVWRTAGIVQDSTLKHGIVVDSVDANTFKVRFAGIETITGHGKTVGSHYFVQLDGTTATTVPSGDTVFNDIAYFPLNANEIYFFNQRAFAGGAGSSSIDIQKTIGGSEYGNVLVDANDTNIQIDSLNAFILNTRGGNNTGNSIFTISGIAAAGASIANQNPNDVTDQALIRLRHEGNNLVPEIILDATDIRLEKFDTVSVSNNHDVILGFNNTSKTLTKVRKGTYHIEVAFGSNIGGGNYIVPNDNSSYNIQDSSFQITRETDGVGFSNNLGVVTYTGTDTIKVAVSTIIGGTNSCDDNTTITVRLRKNTSNTHQSSVTMIANSPLVIPVADHIVLAPGDTLRVRIATGLGTNCTGFTITDYTLLIRELVK